MGLARRWVSSFLRSPGRYRQTMSDSSLSQPVPRSPKGQPGFFRRQLAGAPVTAGILVLCTAVYLLTAALSGSFMDNLRAPDVMRFTLYGDGIAHFGFPAWTVVTGPLLHSGPVHLMSNMLLVFLAAPQVERDWGSVRYLLMVSICALASSAAVLTWSPDLPTVGFSGAVLGIWMVLGAQFYLIDPKLVRGILVFVVVTLAMPFYVGGISWSAHLGGMFAGFAIAVGWYIASRRLVGTTRDRALYAVLAVVGAAVLAWLALAAS